MAPARDPRTAPRAPGARGRAPGGALSAARVCGVRSGQPPPRGAPRPALPSSRPPRETHELHNSTNQAPRKRYTSAAHRPTGGRRHGDRGVRAGVKPG